MLALYAHLTIWYWPVNGLYVCFCSYYVARKPFRQFLDKECVWKNVLLLQCLYRHAIIVACGLHFILRDQITSGDCCCFRLVLCGVTVGSSVTSTCHSVVSRPRVLAGKELRSLTSSTQKLKQSALRYRPYSHFLTLNHKEKQTRRYSFQVVQTTSLQETGGRNRSVQSYSSTSTDDYPENWWYSITGFLTNEPARVILLWEYGANGFLLFKNSRQ